MVRPPRMDRRRTRRRSGMGRRARRGRGGPRARGTAAPEEGAAAAPPTFGNGTPSLPGPQLALAPVDVDDQIAGIGLGTTEQFDSRLLGLDGNTRRVAAASDPPSTPMLILAMFLVP